MNPTSSFPRKDPIWGTPVIEMRPTEDPWISDVSLVGGEVKAYGFYADINWNDQRSIDNFTNRQDNSLVGAFVAEEN